MSVSANHSSVSSHTTKHNKSTGANLPSHQSVLFPSILPEVAILPSTSQVSFGSNSILDLRETGITLENLAIQFLVSDISCTGDVVYYKPAWEWVDKVELVFNSQVVSTLYGRSQFLETQLCFTDDERAKLNSSMGSYQNPSALITKSSKQSSYIINVKSLFGTTSIPLINNKHNIQLRLWLKPLLKCVQTTSGNDPVGLVGGSINATNLVCEYRRLNTNYANQFAKDMAQYHHFYFNDCVFQPFNATITAGGSVDLTLTSIVGKVSFLFFTIQPASFQDNKQYAYFSPIDRWEVLSSSNQNILGGSPLNDSVSKFITSKYFKSTYPLECGGEYTSYLGAQVDNGANVYVWSWSSDPRESITKGIPLGSYRMNGNDRLRVYVPSTFQTGSYNINVFAYVESILEQTSHHIKKILV